MKTSNDVQAVIFKKKSEKLEFLVLCRFDKEKNEDHFRLVKGGIKKNESIEETLRREIKEEIGISKILDKKYLLHYSYISGEVKHEVRVYLVKVNPDTEIKISSYEEGGFTIHEAVWLMGQRAIKKLTFKEEKKLIGAAIKELR